MATRISFRPDEGTAPGTSTPESEAGPELHLVLTARGISLTHHRPRRGANEVQAVIKPHYSTICGSDMNAVAGQKDVEHLRAVVLGHEMVGVVLEGSRLSRGDVVVLAPHSYTPKHPSDCGVAVGSPDYEHQGRGCSRHAGFHWNGAFSTVGRYPEAQLQRIPVGVATRVRERCDGRLAPLALTEPSWPQVLKLRRERGDGVSLASLAIVLASISLFLCTPLRSATRSRWSPVPVSLTPNVVIARRS